MNQQLIKKISQTLLLLTCILIAHTGWFDTIAEDYTEQGIKRTLITYAVSRSLNGVISVAQGTEVAVSPAGVGLTFTPGQILDPINDLIERFSWVVMASATSLGIQRLFLEITSTPAVSWLLTAFIVLMLFFTWRNFSWRNSSRQNPADEGSAQKWQSWQSIINKVLLLIILLRFSVPLIAVLSEGLYLAFLQPKYEQAQIKLENTTEKIKFINDSAVEDGTSREKTDLGLLEMAELWFNKTQQSLSVDKQMQALKQAAADISQQVIDMIVVFVVQTIIFPLLFLWILLRGGKFIISRIQI